MAIINTAPTQIATPYMITLTDQSIPSVDNFQDGSLLFIRDTINNTSTLYQSILQKNAWAPIGSGTGSTPDWATVLGIGANLGDNVTSDANGFYFEFTNLDRFTASVNLGGQLNIGLALTYIGYLDTTDNSILFFFDNTNKVAYTASTAGTGNTQGILLDFFNQEYSYGDTSGKYNGNKIVIRDKSDEIEFDSQVFTFYDKSGTQGVWALIGSNWIYGGNPTTNAGHLKVTINGTQYYIALKT